jgi:hypothetical protein
MALWVPISATLFRRAVLMLWHAFMFLGLRFFPLFFLLLGGLHCFFLQEVLYTYHFNDFVKVRRSCVFFIAFGFAFVRVSACNQMGIKSISLPNAI